MSSAAWFLDKPICIWRFGDFVMERKKEKFGRENLSGIAPGELGT
jgi:hypothetical protein